MTCADVDRRFTDWLAGALSEADARALEAHAASCIVCGDRLEATTRFAPLPPEVTPPLTLRDTVLQSVRQFRTRRRRAQWLAMTTAVAAVLLLALAVQPRRKHASDVPGGAAILFAADRARPELTALDAAEAELLTALRASPNDLSLTHALDALRRQRSQLQRLVRDVAS